MKKLQSFALYALVAPAISLGAGSVLAQQQSDQDADRGAQSSERDQGEMQQLGKGETHAGPEGEIGDQKGQRGAAGQQDSQQAGDRQDDREQYGMEGEAGERGEQRAGERQGAGDDLAERKGYLESAPAEGMHASNIIGTDVKTSGDENLGSVDDLIIDQNGQVVAIVVGVGGFLGMGEKDVAIGWGHVTASGTDDDRQLSVDVTRDELRDAPEFQRRD